MMWCTPSNQAIDEVDPVVLAAIWVHFGAKGSINWVDQCSQKQFRSYLWWRKLKPFSIILDCMYWGLAVFELPSWCASEGVQCTLNQKYRACLMGLPVISNQTCAIIEGVLLVLILMRVRHQKSAFGTAFVFSKSIICGSSMVILAFLDCICCLLVPPTYYHFPLRRCLRPFICMAFSKPLHNPLGEVIRAAPQFLSVIVSLIVVIVVFVWGGIVLFGKPEGGTEPFGSAWHAFVILWTVFTTANSPDAMIPLYTELRLSFIFFFVFIVVSVYVFNNILLGTIYTAYKSELTASTKIFFSNREIAIQRAFKLLTTNDVISRQRWFSFFKAYCECGIGGGQCNEQYNMDRSARIFAALGMDSIDSEAFSYVVNVILDMQTYVPYGDIPALAHTRFGKKLYHVFYHGVSVRWSNKSFSWNTTVDVLIFVSGVLTLIETIWAGGPYLNDTHLESLISLRIMFVAFACFFLLEMAAQLLVIGFERFWHVSILHRIDVVCVISLCLAEVLASLLGNVFLRIPMLLRIGRMLRPLQHLEPLRQLGLLMLRLVPIARQQGLLLLTIFYCYAIFGMECFGGSIYKSNKALLDTDFSRLKYWPLNFNDFPSAMVTLFVLMVVNSWNTIADGMCAAVSSKWSVLFFMSWFVVVNLVLLNIFVALIIDCSAAISSEEEHFPSQYTHVRTHMSLREGAALLRRMLLDKPEVDTGNPEIEHDSFGDSFVEQRIFRRRSSLSILDQRGVGDGQVQN